MASGVTNILVERYSAQEKTETQLALEHLLASCTGSKGALVATADGFVVAKVLKQEIAERKLAAITSSVISLAESMAKETGQGPCQNLVVETQEGTIVSLRINRTRVLTVIADQKTRLGMLLSAAKICAGRLAKSEAEES